MAHPIQPGVDGGADAGGKRSRLPAATAVARASFERIARQCDSDLMRVAKRLCRGDLDCAADLVQETLVRAYQAFAQGRYSDQGSPRPWLMRIMTNHFINEYHRRQKWEAQLPATGETSDETMERLLARQPDGRGDDLPGVRLLNSLFDEEIENALSRLSDPLRVVVILVDVEGLQYDEAAASLGVPIGTIRSRLARARMQLEDLLSDYARSRGRLR